MKRLFACSATAVAVSLCAAGAAHAQSISGQIGGPLLGTIDNASGNFLNLSLNVARIDGSVDVRAVTEIDRTFRSDGSASIIDQDSGLGNLGEIATLAVGAVNDGTVRLGQAGGSESESITTTLDIDDLEVADNIASHASNTSDAAVADYDADFYVSLGDANLNLDLSGSDSFYGPMQDAFAMNVAFNNVNLIDGSVVIRGNGAAAEAIGTTVAGSINTGVITSGLTD